MNYKEVLSENLKRLMEKKGVTSVQVCDALGIPVSTYSDWITMKSYPRMKKLEALAEYFGVKRTELTEEYIDHKKVINDKLFAGISKDLMGFGTLVPEISIEQTEQYYKSIIDLYLSDEQLEELTEYAEFIKNRDEKKKDRQD